MLHLLRQRSFGAMLFSQFLGAFNDNAFKQVVLLLATAIATGGSSEWVQGHWLGGGLGSELPVSLTWLLSPQLQEWFLRPLNWISPQAIPPFLFALPFVAFGPITGSMADRLSKTSIIKAANVVEIGVMAFATLAFWREDYGILLFTVFLMGAQSALFGPSKYGVIKEMVGKKDLAPANALIQSSTMVAVLGGVFVGGVLSESMAGGLWKAGLVCIAFAAIGWSFSLLIERQPAADPTRPRAWNPVREFRSHWRATEGNRELILALCASAFFYLMAATFLIALPTYGKEMGLSDTDASKLAATPGIGIIIGAVLAGRISGKRIEAGLVPLGLLGMAVTLTATALAPTSIAFVSLCFVGMGVFSGLFTIPIRCLIQSLPSEDKRGAVQGLAEVLDFVGILAAPALFSLWDKGLGLSPASMFVVGGVMIAAFAVLSVRIAGEYLVRLILLALTHTVYRLRLVGRDEHVPEEGGVLLVANHVSFIDAILVAAAAGRPVRFLMHKDYFDKPFVGWFARRMGAIGVSGGESREAIEAALAAAAEHCQAGEAVCIFAEGAITRTGAMLPFRRGLEHIATSANVPIIPVALDRLWGSIFSFEGGQFFWKMPRRLPYPVDVLFGAPLPPGTKAAVVRDRVAELIADSRSRQRGRRGSLAWRFLRTARANARRPALVESNGLALSYRRLLIGTLALRRVLRRHLTSADRCVAIMLPPGAGGTLANLALTLDRRTTVNVNATLPNEALVEPLARAGAGLVITSRKLLEVLERTSPLPEGTLFIEDLLGEIGAGDKLIAAGLALLPGPLLAGVAAPRIDPREEVATILYSSGSSGPPKGVELTHGAILSNVQSILQVFPLGPGETLLGVLPHFHSFGYTVGLWATLLGGARAATHPSPLDAQQIGKLCLREKVTILVAAPTFYQAWIRRIEPEAFAAVKIAVAGAEKLRPELAQAFHERFGVTLLEGYGCTECGPVVSFNLLDTPGLGAQQRAHRPGSVGRPLPGVALRTVDPETRAPRAVGEEGLLEVKSPALMRGYLADPERTAECLVDGWYETGDVGRIDKDGFLLLTDRLARFSKIGGEMVPHGRVEEELFAVAARLDVASGLELAVTAREDARRGERLVVIHTSLTVTAAQLVAGLEASDLPALFRPKATDFLEVSELPRLPTGKLDLMSLKRLAGGAG